MKRAIQKISKKVYYVSILAGIIFPQIVQAQYDGKPDNRFNGTGYIVTSAMGVARHVVQQPDSKILVIGSTYVSSHDYAVMRINTDGTTDTGFATNGIFVKDIDGGMDIAQECKLQQDGKIIVTGYSTGTSTSEDWATIRLNQDGSIDNSFGTNGVIKEDFFGYNDQAMAIAIQSDGKILVGGVQHTGAIQKYTIIRYNTDGSRDTGFGTSGVFEAAFNGENTIRRLHILSDGKILFSGKDSDNGWKYSIGKINTDGTFDSTFGTNGHATFTFGGSLNTVKDMTVLADGKILLTGDAAFTTGGYNLAMLKLNQDGSIDNTFGNAGKAFTDIFGQSESAYTIAVQPDGKIILGGASDSTGVQRAVLVRYNDNGTIDSTFGTNGIQYYNPGSYTALLNMYLTSDNKIIACGYSDSKAYLLKLYATCTTTAVNNAITMNVDTLEAAQTGAMYQWIDCNNANTAINGATSKKFVPATSGNYAVIINMNICSIDTSECISIIPTSLAKQPSTKYGKIYPNPAHDFLQIHLGKNEELYIYSPTGILIKQLNLQEGNNTLYLTDFPEGIYYIKTTEEVYKIAKLK